MALNEVSSSRCFGGYQKVFSHDSKELKCRMKFAIYIPVEADSQRVPVIYWLSGLECNELNFVQKAGGQRFAAEHGFAVVCPDTSPRGCGIAGEDDKWDFGTAAGFYLDASHEPWATNYRMYSYVTQELPQLINEHFPIDGSKQSIMGHRFAFHYLILSLESALVQGGAKRTDGFEYSSRPKVSYLVSFFGKFQSGQIQECIGVCTDLPSDLASPVGRQAFRGYFGDDTEDKWSNWDATCLVEHYDGPPLEILSIRIAADMQENGWRREEALDRVLWRSRLRRRNADPFKWDKGKAKEEEEEDCA
ncbi:hypothetical protein LSTR_LSTR005944 [Laodelphax striatellus]|uniref:S-formylglutathione hydrolase n=1 Tax=Laodelphax striatellus TaxID=195883 RepID=A0A482WFC0_LAOST|nr:hypothetical protein LSTR_LSTR005944 [Laodelphax striatellus]